MLLLPKTLGAIRMKTFSTHTTYPHNRCRVNPSCPCGAATHPWYPKG
jgi:hypothetical protein